ncbi:MAG TPA: hypothetical protein VMP42_06065 [Actinomycetota bacterium]|nr:hypothetical protein [Actinomycetota bacterium]
MDAAVRSVGRAKGRRSLLDLLLARPRPPEPHVGDLRDRGDDVWKALRF